MQNNPAPSKILIRFVIATVMVGSLSIQARPAAPVIFCDTYPDIPLCAGKIPSCNTCHDSISPTLSWNAYGISLFPHLSAGEYTVTLPAALRAVEGDDADDDGDSNLQELHIGSDLVDSSSTVPDRTPDEPNGENTQFTIGEYDPRFALRRVSNLFCGASPSFDELMNLEQLDDEDARQSVHDKLDLCLESDFWRTEALIRLADPWVKPVFTLGPDTNFQVIPGVYASIADYHYDYRLFSYVMTGDRDVRELVTAQYHIEEGENGEWVKVEGVIPQPPPVDGSTTVNGGQKLEPELRSGLITAHWTATVGVLAADLPRVLVGHLYRVYLGMDIGLMEGLINVPGEPLDIDNKGVDETGCAHCHATLDPATYALATINSLGPEPVWGLINPDRPASRMPGWNEADPQGVFLGKPVSSVADVGQVIADSDAFLRNLAEIFFEYSLGSKPQPGEFEDFNELWQNMPEDNYSINKMLHRLVDSNLFGAP